MMTDIDETLANMNFNWKSTIDSKERGGDAHIRIRWKLDFFFPF